MKIMEVSSEEGECQIETVINSKTKKTKQARLPFQTLSSDSPLTNKKKRKSQLSPDCRNAKQAKVNTKENSFKISKKTENEDMITEEIVQTKEENTVSETDIVKDSSKQAEITEVQDSKCKKSTPDRVIGKSRKSESKVVVNSLTKFLKKFDNKEIKNETSVSNSKAEESKTKNNVNSKSEETLEKSKHIVERENTSNTKDVSKPSEDQKQESNKCDKKLEITSDDDSDSECKQKSEESNDEESKESLSNNEQADTSHLNGTKNTDVDSDINLLSDDSNDDDDDDDGQSDTDDKKTEHEETDSKDDVCRSDKMKPSTPTRNKLLNSATKEKKLTPKQVERKLEIQKQRENRAKQRLEREKKLQEERENRKKEKEEKRREREEKERLLKEQKRKEKELKELKKQAENEQKQKEKEAKEEDRRKREEAKEEERRRKEEEKLEAERKKQKAASNFVSFFVAKKPTETKSAEEDNKVESRNFMPFEIKADMRVAPSTRRTLTESEKSSFDKLLDSNLSKPKLYIGELKNKKFQVRKSERTWPYETNDDIVILEEEEDDSSNIVQPSNISREKHRAKLLMFQDNRRPPYWGTWRKKSKFVNPRRPFAKDTEWFDYEVDSDEEWEEEEPGESLRGSDDEKDEENAEENEYEVDNDFMVPHGYLSEEEIGADEEDEDLNPEKQKTKLKMLGEQFEAERNTKTTKLKPKVIGCVWMNKDNTYPENTPSHAVKFLTLRHAWVREIPVTLTAPVDADNLADNECGNSSNKQHVASSARKAKALEEAMPDLIRLLHGNTHGRNFLVKEFLEYWSKKKGEEKPIFKAKLLQKIREIATWKVCSEAGPMQDRSCWHVNEECQRKYLGTEKLPLPNQWTYCLTPKKKNIVTEVTEKPNEKEKEKKTVPLITQFTKTLTAEEMQKQLVEKSSTPTSKVNDKSTLSASVPKPTPPLNRPPKRASLISVPRGESIPKSPRVSLMDKFVTKDSSNTNTSNKDEKSRKVSEEDCMIIDNDDEKVDITSVSSEANATMETSDIESKVQSKGDQTTSVENNESDDKSGDVSKNSSIEIIDI